MTEMTSTAAYWEPLWAQGRRYRQLDDAETQLLDGHIGPGRGRTALDVGSGDGALARHLHDLGYRTTGIDCSPSAVALAASRSSGLGLGLGPVWQCLDITTGNLSSLPEPAYAVIICRLVYRWMDDKPAFLDCVRRLLAPGGTFWVVTEISGRRQHDHRLKDLGITLSEAETLAAGWSHVHTADLDVLRCYALRP
ncbi:class I SAM-dependent methyltransferase [Streptomyces sp. NPDC001728]|uniref:class I SAM-dependent methyltransferase n=1 Tax=Streptomyces sp. NPDC001728 TaxID=3154396 RepID=UPI00331E2D93